MIANRLLVTPLSYHPCAFESSAFLRFFYRKFLKLVAILIGFSSSAAYCHVDVDQFINKLPENEQQELDSFFRYLMTVSNFGYTLFGAKPVSVDAWSNEPSLSYLFFPMVNNEIILKKGWSLWMKYSYLFAGKIFCFRATPHSNGRSIAIYLINKVKTNAILKSHLENFKKYLGNHVTASSLLKGLENDPSIMDQTLLGSEELLGILLGYGAVNAQKFQDFAELTEIKNRTPTFPRQLQVAPTDSPWERKLQRLEWNKSHIKHPVHLEVEPEKAVHQLKLIKWERARKSEDPLAQISLPSFRRIADEQESDRWDREYQTTRLKIISVLNDPNFLKIVLLEISK